MSNKILCYQTLSSITDKDTMTSTATSSMNEFKGIQPKEFFRQHVERGFRTDGRESLTTLREVSVSQGTIATADASAVVKQGSTIVVCGIKLELAPTTPGEPNQGKDSQSFYAYDSFLQFAHFLSQDSL